MSGVTDAVAHAGADAEARRRTAEADAPVRRRIAEDLEHSLVVMAGAGTGKTTVLVGRVVELVRAGTPLRELAVITFSEAAATELRSRLSEALTTAYRHDPANRALAHTVVEAEEVAVCTLHAFARRMLVEHALAAELPPDFDVLDDVTDRAEFESRLVRFTDQLLDDDSAETTLLRGFVLGLDAQGIAEVAWCLHNHWDRLEEPVLRRIEAARPEPGRWPAVDLGPLVELLERAGAMTQWCTDEDDLLLGHLRGRVHPAQAVLSAAAGDEQAALPLLVRLPAFTCGLGRRRNWGEHLDEVRRLCDRAEQARRDLLQEVGAPVLAEMLARLARFTLDASEERSVRGRLTFHDLLVHARRLLRSHEGARAALRSRYRRLLIDEFQDTDPLQVELAAWLASAVEGSGDLDHARPGALFVVGDPKQSIYRFRRADVELFEHLSAAVGDDLVLETNFRSVPGIVRFVNAVIPPLFGVGREPRPVDYHPLQWRRPPLPARPGAVAVQLALEGFAAGEPDPVEPALPPVVLLGGAVDGSVGESRRSSARDLAAALRRAMAERWPVSDAQDPAKPARRLRWRDIAVLIPTRSSLPALEEAFDDAAVPFHLEGAALLWGSEEVHDVLCVLSAADEPSDAVSVLAALRSPGLACGDDDLVDWNSAGGSWDPRAEAPAGSERHPVGRAMAVLADLHSRRWWCEPSQLVAAAIEELNGYELAFVAPRPRQGWQRLRWLADQARLFDETVGGSLHDFLVWADLQCQGDGRSAILGSPEADDDAVRVMTVHGAKGLEFPVVALAGLEREDSSPQRADAVLWGADGRVDLRLSPRLRSIGYEQAAAADRELDRSERVRLLYVAMTRARDHLVLCLHRARRDDAVDTSQAATLEEQCRAHPLLWRRMADLDVETGAFRAAFDADGGRSIGDGPATGRGDRGDPGETRRWAAELGEWTAHRDQILHAGTTLRVVTASGLSLDLGAPTTADTDERRSAGDTAIGIGRAVHDALARVDLRTGGDAAGSGATEVARHSARAHGVTDHADEVVERVCAALSSPVLRRASNRVHHNEAYLAMPLGEPADGIFEGFVDLLVEDDDGLVVVDYKTGPHRPTEGPAGRAEPSAGQRMQVAAYALAAEAATGHAVVRGVLLFLDAEGAHEHTMSGPVLEEAKAAARRALFGSR